MAKTQTTSDSPPEGTFKEKIRSVNFGFGSKRTSKTTVDVHDTHTVEVTEHWNDRQDVNVKPNTIKRNGPKAHGA